MTAPYIWIGIPLVVSVLMMALPRQRRVTPAVIILTTLLLALLAMITPIGAAIKFGKYSVQIADTLQILGRRFIIENSDRSLLVLVYGFATFWLLATGVGKTQARFLPLGLAICGLLVAAVAVQPFLYAALLIEMAVLVSVPLLKKPGAQISQGVLRYLIFQTLALPFILLAGWLIGGVEANPSDQVFLNRTVILLAMGFSFWLAIFPFYSWVPLLAEEAHPYEAGFIMMLLPTITLFLSLDFLDNYAWLREYPLLFPALQVSGVIMIATGGVWAAFQTNLKRLIGYGVIIEIGFSLLAISLASHVGLQLFSMFYLPRIINVAVMALSLTILQKYYGSLSFSQISGSFKKLPFASGAFLVALFSLAGFPLLAGFPAHQVLLENLTHQNQTIIWILVGVFATMISGFRVLSVMTGGDETHWRIGETRSEIFFLVGGILMIFLIGIFPNAFLPMMTKLVSGYTHLW
jgi:NADH-quinone oxidoreductase subunit N